MIKYQKKPILVMVGKPFFIRHTANERHNETTVLVAQFALSLNGVLTNGSQGLTPNLLRAVLRGAKGFQGIGLDFNGNPQAPAFTFTVKAKTERRGEDPHDQELADKIVTAKVNMRACNIAKSLISSVIAYHKSEIENMTPIAEMLGYYAAREVSYLEKASSTTK